MKENLGKSLCVNPYTVCNSFPCTFCITFAPWTAAPGWTLFYAENACSLAIWTLPEPPCGIRNSGLTLQSNSSKSRRAWPPRYQISRVNNASTDLFTVIFAPYSQTDRHVHCQMDGHISFGSKQSERNKPETYVISYNTLSKCYQLCHSKWFISRQIDRQIYCQTDGHSTLDWPILGYRIVEPVLILSFISC